MYPSGFNALPVELCELVVNYTKSRKAISNLCRTCKRNYNIFIPFLYSEFEVNQRVGSTLSIAPKERALASLPHPASFVKDLQLEFDDNEFRSTSALRQAVDAFQNMAHLVLKNVVEQSGGRPPLKRLTVDTRVIPFPRMVGSLDIGCFRNLVDLSLVCEFPDTTVQDTMSILSSFENQNLTSLHLGVLECGLVSRTPKPQLLAQLLDVIANTFTNLTFLGLAIPISHNRGADPVNEVLKNMTFPSLRSLLVNGYGGAGDTKLNFLPLLANHPRLEFLEYFSSRPIPNELVPRLKSFTGSCIECISICESKRPISEVHAHFDQSHLTHKFKNVRILRRVSLTCSAGELPSSSRLAQCLLNFIKAFPRIIHLDLDVQYLELPYSSAYLMNAKLSRLKTLKVYNRVVIHYLPDYFVIQALRSYANVVVKFWKPNLRRVTVEISITDPSKGKQLNETFIYTVHPHKKGVGRVMKGLAVHSGARVKVDVNAVMSKLQQERDASA